jgi:hypothetical protein
MTTPNETPMSVSLKQPDFRLQSQPLRVLDPVAPELRPFFPYYGAKWRLCGYLPAPRHDILIEPFAGSAGYSMRYGAGKQVMLFDRDDNIVRTWQYLLRVGASEILSLPDLEVGQSVDSLDISPEARLLIGWWINRGSSRPGKSRTAYSARNDKAQLNWGARARQRIADQLPAITRWTVRLGDYREAPDIEATWLIDPPYKGRPGSFYRFNDVDYPALADWSRSRRGQVMVCEGENGDWLPFGPFGSHKTSKGKSPEKLWTN